jgi:hypothetical protein
VSKRLNEAARMLGRKGGRTAARNMTKQQRRERALRGTRSRWARQSDADLARLQKVLPLARAVAPTGHKPRTKKERA